VNKAGGVAGTRYCYAFTQVLGS